MRTVLSVLFIALSSAGFCQHYKKPGSFKLLKIIPVHLNNDNSIDSIFISSSLNDKKSFNKIEISLSGFGRQIFFAKNSWTNIDPAFLSSNKNFILSKQLFVQKATDHCIILLFGVLDGAGYREDFSIINIKNNQVRLAFDRNENDIDIELPIKLMDLNKDGLTDLVFKNYGEMSEQVDSLDANIGSYSPYLVYTINNNFKLNKILTKQYNEKHYVFAGYEDSEKIKILYPNNKKKKPTIWKAK